MIHTVPSLAETLGEQLAAAEPDVDVIHVVVPELLQKAIDGVPEADLADEIAGLVESLKERGAQAVLVSCSSLGGATDLVARRSPIPLHRIDRRMAQEAVGLGGRIGVLATLRSTLGPTVALVEREAAAVGATVTVLPRLVEGAAAAAAAGRLDEHARLIGEAVDAMAAEVDVILLAQASMAAAMSGRRPPPVPVLTSPASGVTAFAASIRTSLSTPRPEDSATASD